MNDDERNRIELTRKLVELVKHLSTLEAELRSLGSVISKGDAGASPDLLTAMKESEEYRRIQQQYEPLIARLEEATRERETQSLLEAAPASERVQ